MTSNAQYDEDEICFNYRRFNAFFEQDRHIIQKHWRFLGDLSDKPRIPILFHKTINDCLLGRRSDLDQAIWQAIGAMIEEHAFENNLQNTASASTEQVIEGQYKHKFPKFGRAMLEYYGFNIAPVLFLSITAHVSERMDGIELTSKRLEQPIIVRTNPGCAMDSTIICTQHHISRMVLGNTILNHHGIVTPIIPKTLQNALIGKPLSALISHPVLDMFEYKIDEIFNAMGSTHFIMDWAGNLEEEENISSKPLPKVIK